MAGRNLGGPPSHPGTSGALLPHHPSPNSNKSTSMTIFLSKSTPFIAGEKVTGLLELDVLIGNNKVALGELGIEFTGLEELRSLDHTATRILLTSRLDFQGPTLSPSAAIVPNSLPVNYTFYPALKGRTRFPFSFTLPSASPSSCSLGANATTRYELRAFASSLQNNEVDIKTTRKEIKVVERWGDWEIGNWTEACLRRGGESLKLGGEGKLEMMAEMGRDGSGRLFWRTEREAGMEGNGTIKVRVKVRNGTKKHVSGLKLSICRRLRILDAKASGMSIRAPIITSTVLLDHFRGIGYEFPVGEEKEVIISTEVPLEESWTVRKGTLFELDVLLRVEVECGFLTKDLAVELPIWIAHPRSLPPAAHAHRQRINTQVIPALPPITHPPFPGSRNAMSPVELPYAYPYSQLPQQYQDPYNRLTSPVQQHSFPNSVSAPILYHQQHLPHQQHPHHPHYVAQVPYPPSSQYSIPHYPPPTPPVGRGTPSPIPAPYYIAFDPYSPDLTQSKFLASLNGHQPNQSMVSPEIIHSLPSPLPPPPSTVQVSQGYSQPLPQPPQIISRPASVGDLRHSSTSPISTTLSPPPASYSPVVVIERATSPIERPLSSRSFRPHEMIGLGVGVENTLGRIGMMESELERVKANVAPLDPYSATLRASMSKEDLRASLMVAGRSNTVPLPSSHPQVQVQPQAQILPIVINSPTPSNPPARYEIQKSFSTNSISRPTKTPPPPPPSAPSSRFATPSRSPSPSTRTLPSQFIEESNELPNSLDTIGEDGESQAGTTRSMHDLAALLKRDNEETSYHSVQADGNSPGRNSVSDLEDLVDEEDRRVELEKSLPRLPNLSSGEKRKSSGDGKGSGVMRAQDIFRTTSQSSTPTTSTTLPMEIPTISTTPTLVPPTPIRSERGLKALEARLSRPSTPELSNLPLSTTTITTIRPMSPLQDSTTIASPAAFKSGALRARSLSRVTSERNLAKMLTGVKPEEEVRKALEAKRREDELKEQEMQKENEKEQEVLRPTAVKSISSSEIVVAAISSPEQSSNNTSSMPPSTSSTSIASNSSIPLTLYVDGRKVVDLKEVKDLKKEAVARVSDWMKVDASSSAIPTTTTSKPLKRSTFDFVRHAPLPPSSTSTRSTSPGISRSLSSSPVRASPITERSTLPTVKVEKEPTMEELLKAESRAGRLANPPSNSKVAKSFAKKLGTGVDENGGGGGRENLRELGVNSNSNSNSMGEFGARYDVKSARGGRGGVVSSVANKWASMIDGDEETKDSRSRSSSPIVPKALKLNSSVQNTSSPIITRRAPIPTSSSTSIPVVIQKSSPAKAFVNTTMGKPPILANNTPLDRVASPVGEGERKGKGGMIDLIARYQTSS